MSFISDPGFELGGGWTYIQNAVRVTGIQHSGAFSARVLVRRVQPHPGDPVFFEPGYFRSEQLAATPGQHFALAFWLQGAAGVLSTLQVNTDLGTGSFGEAVSLVPNQVADWTFFDLAPLTALGSYVQVEFRAAPSPGVGTWYVDDVTFGLEDAVSIYGTWTAKHYFAQTLRTYLGAEVTAINTENPAAGLVLYVPTTADVVTYSLAAPDQAWTASHPALFEVLCDAAAVGDYAPSEISPGILSQDHDIALRISVVDRTNGNIAALYDQVELYVAACDRVTAIEHQALGFGPVVESCIPQSVEYRNTEADKIIRQATRHYTVRTSEVNA